MDAPAPSSANANKILTTPVQASSASTSHDLDYVEPISNLMQAGFSLLNEDTTKSPVYRLHFEQYFENHNFQTGESSGPTRLIKLFLSYADLTKTTDEHLVQCAEYLADQFRDLFGIEIYDQVFLALQRTSSGSLYFVLDPNALVKFSDKHFEVNQTVQGETPADRHARVTKLDEKKALANIISPFICEAQNSMRQNLGLSSSSEVPIPGKKKSQPGSIGKLWDTVFKRNTSSPKSTQLTDPTQPTPTEKEELSILYGIAAGYRAQLEHDRSFQLQVKEAAGVSTFNCEKFMVDTEMRRIGFAVYLKTNLTVRNSVEVVFKHANVEKANKKRNDFYNFCEQMDGEWVAGLRGAIDMVYTWMLEDRFPNETAGNDLSDRCHFLLGFPDVEVFPELRYLDHDRSKGNSGGMVNFVAQKIQCDPGKPIFPTIDSYKAFVKQELSQVALPFREGQRFPMTWDKKYFYLECEPEVLRTAYREKSLWPELASDDVEKFREMPANVKSCKTTLEDPTLPPSFREREQQQLEINQNLMKVFRIFVLFKRSIHPDEKVRITSDTPIFGDVDAPDSAQEFMRFIQSNPQHMQTVVQIFSKYGELGQTPFRNFFQAKLKYDYVQKDSVQRNWYSNLMGITNCCFNAYIFRGTEAAAQK